VVKVKAGRAGDGARELLSPLDGRPATKLHFEKTPFTGPPPIIFPHFSSMDPLSAISELQHKLNDITQRFAHETRWASLPLFLPAAHRVPARAVAASAGTL